MAPASRRALPVTGAACGDAAPAVRLRAVPGCVVLCRGDVTGRGSAPPVDDAAGPACAPAARASSCPGGRRVLGGAVGLGVPSGMPSGSVRGAHRVSASCQAGRTAMARARCLAWWPCLKATTAPSTTRPPRVVDAVADGIPGGPGSPGAAWGGLGHAATSTAGAVRWLRAAWRSPTPCTGDPGWKSTRAGCRRRPRAHRGHPVGAHRGRAHPVRGDRGDGRCAAPASRCPPLVRGGIPLPSTDAVDRNHPIARRGGGARG
ncbi:hypothetical protein QJS66_21910 [Kocuria rhizophila]|nr:hypothetical protein QJS66_21910 [Kocuria rhizophila]